MKKALFLVLFPLCLTACDGTPKRDYDAQARCRDRGILPDNPELADCIKEERAARMMEQNRNEYEKRQQDEDYWRARRSIGAY